jgi:hypothetical protein
VFIEIRRETVHQVLADALVEPHGVLAVSATLRDRVSGPADELLDHGRREPMKLVIHH